MSSASSGILKNDPAATGGRSRFVDPELTSDEEDEVKGKGGKSLLQLRHHRVSAAANTSPLPLTSNAGQQVRADGEFIDLQPQFDL